MLPTCPQSIRSALNRRRRVSSDRRWVGDDLLDVHRALPIRSRQKPMSSAALTCASTSTSTSARSRSADRLQLGEPRHTRCNCSMAVPRRGFWRFLGERRGDRRPARSSARDGLGSAGDAPSSTIIIARGRAPAPCGDGNRWRSSVRVAPACGERYTARIHPIGRAFDRFAAEPRRCRRWQAVVAPFNRRGVARRRP